MQRALCSICTDLFVEAADISAVPCGHIFHAGCLDRWMQQAKTCPQCRKNFTQRNLIKKLFLDLGDVGDEAEEDPSRVKNELSTAQTLLRQREREKQELHKDKVTLEVTVEDLRETIKQRERLFNEEVDKAKELRRQLHFHRTLQNDAEAAKQEARKLRTKLAELQAVESVINGSDEEIQSMVQNQGDAKQLATWCAVIQRELTTKRQDNKQLRSQVQSLKKEVSDTKRSLAEKSKALAVSVEKVSVMEDEVRNAESEVKRLRQKLDAASKVMRTPKDTPTHYIQRMVLESPAPRLEDMSPFSARPRGKRPRIEEEEIDLDTSADMFGEPASPPEGTSHPPAVPAGPSPSVQTRKECKEFGTKFVKISSAAASSQGRKRDMADISNLAGMNIMRKTNQGITAIKNGYNGMGGHEKFLVPKSKTSIFKKPQNKVKSGVFAKNRQCSSFPKLPTLDLDL